MDLTGRRDLRLSERGHMLRAVVGSLEVGALLRKCGGEGRCCRKGQILSCSLWGPGGAGRWDSAQAPGRAGQGDGLRPLTASGAPPG